MPSNQCARVHFPLRVAAPLLLSCAFALCAGRGAVALETPAAPLLLQDPTISRTQIAFTYGGDIWTVPRGGGAAKRLVTGFGLATGPIFSPDGSRIAFSGDYDGNVDVYVVAAAGGEPRRLTYHPGRDVAEGWTPDGKDVLFRSPRASFSDPNELFTVPRDGGFPAQVPLATAESGSYSPDGTHLAYVPNFRWEPFWKGYRGGQTTPIYVADLADSSVERIPRRDSNDDTPMWLGDTIYFLSDRDGPVTLYAYDTRSHRVTRALANAGFDITGASAGAGAIVYSQFGALHVFDPVSHTEHAVAVTVAADMPQVRPHWIKVGDQIENAAISPSGVRALFEAHGSILTLPGEHGDVRTIAAASNVANRDPAWSPDGRSIAYFSDESGEYALHVRDQKGLAPARVIPLGTPPSYFYSPLWSPDSKKIAYSDKRLNLWYVDVANPQPVKVATAPFGGFGPNQFDVAWSPDSRWLAYVDVLPNFLHAVDVFSLDGRRSRQVTDGLSDARYPQFDAGGKYLYFAASTNTGLTSQGLDMTSDEHPVSSNVYVAVLARTVDSPVKPQSDDEPVPSQDEPGPAPVAATATPGAAMSASAKPAPSKTAAAKPARAKGPEPVTIDFDGILQRIVALPIPEGNVASLSAGKAGQLFITVLPLVQNGEGQAKGEVVKYDGASRKTTPFAGDVTDFALSANGEKALYQQDDRWFLTDAGKPAMPGAGALDMSRLEVYVDPPTEWRQMYHETWRIERDFFYDPHHHGLDLAAAERRFEPYLAGVSSRNDLSFLFREMLSYLSVGHMFVRGGTEPAMPRISTGLLGADYRIENGRYRFSRIYNGENWNPDLSAPLTQPGADVKAGEYLLAVQGRSLGAADNLYAAFQETAGKQVVIRVGPSPNGTGARDVTVVPVADESALRNLAWIEANRRKVDQLSGGKLAYVYLPDTGFGGFTNFNRYFFAQVGKQGVILDERYNHGGQIADYIIDYLNRKPMSILQPREGKLMVDPPLAIYGPKVMLINQYAGSGGDALPWYFRKAKLGPLVGVRTWGGLVGIGGTPTLKDGGTVEAPNIAIGGLRGKWEVEGNGVAPDIEVWQDPKLVRQGHDPQLEAGVAEAMKLLRAHPVPTYSHPPYPDHHPVLPPPDAS
jgi:tricorn protease